MYIIRNFFSLCLIFLFCSSFVCSFPSPEEKSDAPKKDESEEELETTSPEEIDKLKNEIKEFDDETAKEFHLSSTLSPEEIDTYIEKEKEKYGKKLPDKIEEDLKLGKSLVQILELLQFEKELSEDKIVEKSPAEMKEMKEEVFQLTNKYLEKKELPAVSQEEFDKAWDQNKEKYGKKFPAQVERGIKLLKMAEEAEEEKEEKESESPLETSTELSETAKVPKDAFVVRNENEKVCMLAKFHSRITITFPGKTSELKAEIHVPETAKAKGKCGDLNKPRSMHILWEAFNFTLMFDKTPEDMWAVTSVEFNYDTSGPLFDGAVDPGRVTAKGKKEKWFETPLGKSYFCPSQEVILYSEDQHVATVQMKEVHLQPYDIEDETFSSSHHCIQVVIGGLDEEPFVQDETIPLAVGCTLAIITLLILVGFSVHRAYNAAKVDYNTVE